MIAHDVFFFAFRGENAEGVLYVMFTAVPPFFMRVCRHMEGASQAKQAGAELLRCHKLFVNEVRTAASNNKSMQILKNDNQSEQLDASLTSTCIFFVAMFINLEGIDINTTRFQVTARLGGISRKFTAVELLLSQRGAFFFFFFFP